MAQGIEFSQGYQHAVSNLRSRDSPDYKGHFLVLCDSVDVSGILFSDVFHIVR